MFILLIEGADVLRTKDFIVFTRLSVSLHFAFSHLQDDSFFMSSMVHRKLVTVVNFSYSL